MFPTYRLEVLLCSRPHKIDELYAKFEQARAQNRKLEAEAAIFAAIRRASSFVSNFAADRALAPQKRRRRMPSILGGAHRWLTIILL